MQKSKVMEMRQGLLAATLQLFVELINELSQSGFVVKDTYPKDYKKLHEYLMELPVGSFRKWCKFVCCMVSPVSYTEGNNHIIFIDNGLFSKYLATLAPLHYDRESCLLTKHIFGINRRLHPIGDIHVHIVGSQQLLEACNGKQENIIFELKKIIDRKHEHMETQACRLVRLGSSGELVTVENWQLFEAVRSDN